MDKSNNLLQPIAGDQDHSHVPFVVIFLREWIQVISGYSQTART